MLCLGLGLMALVGLMSYRSDLHLASQNLTDATQYVKQQRTAYDRFNDTSVTKSLMRVIENAQQIASSSGSTALTGWTTPPCAGTSPRTPYWELLNSPLRATPPASGWTMAPTWTWLPTAAPTSRA